MQNGYSVAPLSWQNALAYCVRRLGADSYQEPRLGKCLLLTNTTARRRFASAKIVMWAGPAKQAPRSNLRAQTSRPLNIDWTALHCSEV